MPDIPFQNLNVAQGDKQQTPPTIASAARIAPTTRLTFVTGTVQLQNIIPPTSGYCEIVLCFTDASPGLFLTTGNIQVAHKPITNRPTTLYFDPSSNKWWVAGAISVATIDLTSTQLGSLSTSPVTVIPGQGNNTVIIPYSVDYQYIGGTFPFANASSLQTQYVGGVEASTGENNNIRFDMITSQYGGINQFTKLLVSPSSVNNVGYQVKAATDPTKSGTILTSTLSNAGVNWVVNDTFLLHGDFDGGTGIVDSVSSGHIVTYHLTNGGTSHYIGEVVDITGTGGSIGTAQITVSTITNVSDGTLRVSIAYYVMPLHS